MTRIRNSREHLESYSELYLATAQVYYPTSLDQLRAVFTHAKEAKRRVTIRGGGHSFDEQSLGNDIVVCMDAFDKIEISEARQQMCVEAGATWGSIVAELEPRGLVPAGTVTSSHATAAGTLSADCLSRFSPRYGKEASHVERFSFLKLDGTLLECTRPPDGAAPATWTDGQRAFMGAIGGFGYLGAIVDVTYNLLSIGQPEFGVQTRVQKYNSFDGLASDLVPAVAEAAGPPAHAAYPRCDAIYAGLYPAGEGGPSWMLFSSTFTTSRKRHKLLLNQRNNPIRIAGEWLMRVPLLCRFLSWCFFTFTRNNATYIDDLGDYMFFMDANTNAKRIARRFNIRLPTVQQTFIVPVDLAKDGGRDAQKRLVDWLDHAHTFLRSQDLAPTLQDVLFLPQDLAFSLSPDGRSPGFAVSYAFETSDGATLKRAQEAMAKLAEVLWTRFQGRVSLVKNVCVDQPTLLKMYGADAVEFCKLKEKFDPDGILRNDFLERTFGPLTGGGGATPSTAGPTPGYE